MRHRPPTPDKGEFVISVIGGGVSLLPKKSPNQSKKNMYIIDINGVKLITCIALPSDVLHFSHLN